jgi:hypothetical protein
MRVRNICHGVDKIIELHLTPTPTAQIASFCHKTSKRRDSYFRNGRNQSALFAQSAFAGLNRVDRLLRYRIGRI